MALSKNTAIMSELSAIRSDIGVIKEDMGSMKGKIGSMEGKIDSLEFKTNSISYDLKQLSQSHAELYQTVLSFKNETAGRFDDLYNKFYKNNEEYYAITAGMRRIEEEHKIIDHKTILEEIQSLKNRN